MSDVIENTLQELKAFCVQRLSDYEEAYNTLKAVVDAYDEDLTYGELEEWGKQSQAQIEDLQIDFFDSHLGHVSQESLACGLADLAATQGYWGDAISMTLDCLSSASERCIEMADQWKDAEYDLPDLDDYSPNRLVYWIGSFSDICDNSDEQKIMDICEPLTGKI